MKISIKHVPDPKVDDLFTGSIFEDQVPGNTVYETTEYTSEDWSILLIHAILRDLESYAFKMDIDGKERVLVDFNEIKRRCLSHRALNESRTFNQARNAQLLAMLGRSEEISRRSTLPPPVELIHVESNKGIDPNSLYK